MRERFVVACLFFLGFASCSSSNPDYGDQTLQKMRQYTLDRFTTIPGAVLRPVTASFEDYDIQFGVSRLKVILYAYESLSLVNACISQFEITPDSGRYMDFTFVIRPNADVRAPLIHGDALATSFSMDLYNVNPSSVNVAAFLGERIEKINQGLDLAQQYQRKPPEEGGDRGKYTPHLDPYKSPYRIELEKPETDDPEEQQRYWDTVYEVLTLYLSAFLESIESLPAEDNETLIQGNIAGIDTFITTLWEKDFVVPMGKMMFKDDMELYFLDAFWRKGVYFSDVSQKQ